MDFTNLNLCGASPELNSVLEKLDAAKSEITGSMDSLASEAAASFGLSQNELTGLIDKLQTIELPTLPKLNLQAEIANLASLVPGSLSSIQALAKINTEFGGDLTAKGLELDSLAKDAFAAITGGGSVCSLVANLEKVAGSTAAAGEKPVAVKQAADKAVTEVKSTVWQNPDVAARVKVIEEKTVEYAVTPEEPTEDTGAFKLVKAETTISTSSGPTKVALTGTGKNVASGGGFSNKKSTITESFSASKIEDLGRDGTFKFANWKTTLLHEPIGKIIISIHPAGPNANALLKNTPTLGRYYSSDHGLHMMTWINTGRPGSIGNTAVKINGKEINFESPFELADHPGNIDSGGNTADRTREQTKAGVGGASLDGPDVFRCYGIYPPTVAANTKRYGPGRWLHDSIHNRALKGQAVRIQYDYLNNYDADPKTT